MEARSLLASISIRRRTRSGNVKGAKNRKYAGRGSNANNINNKKTKQNLHYDLNVGKVSISFHWYQRTAHKDV